jgi:hypothetical protein
VKVDTEAFTRLIPPSAASHWRRGHGRALGNFNATHDEVDVVFLEVLLKFFWRI